MNEAIVESEVELTTEEKIDYIYRQMQAVEDFLERAAQNPMLRAFIPKG